ncbi:MAG: acetyl-CoA carboxylase biotin carboxyl carrier protein [Planctomycetes bacterium]|nr:acetyl-CoA carboxylase biotin carboxyl carrier protein [Planctomycetota bacterium]
MDTDLIERLLTLMDEGGLTELVYEKDDIKVKLSRRQDSGSGGNTLVVPAAAATAAPMASGSPAPTPAQAVVPAEEEEVGVELFRSPMVGTFYSRPNPDSDIFVRTGDQVSDESVLCILEAMKVFNEIQAEMSGEIVACLAQDGEAVEFDQPLFKIRTN